MTSFELSHLFKTLYAVIVTFWDLEGWRFHIQILGRHIEVGSILEMQLYTEMWVIVAMRKDNKKIMVTDSTDNHP